MADVPVSASGAGVCFQLAARADAVNVGDLRHALRHGVLGLPPVPVLGTVYVRVASSPSTSMPSTKLRMSTFNSGIVPSSRKSAAYLAIPSGVPFSLTVYRQDRCRLTNWSSDAVVVSQFESEDRYGG